MKTLLLAIALIALAGCAAFGPTYSGGDGSSYEQAVIIKTIYGEESGINAENSWIHKHYRGAKVKMQALKNPNGKAYDVISIVLPDGSTKDVYFDITDFIGK